MDKPQADGSNLADVGTVKIHFSKIRKGATEGLMFVNGTIDFMVQSEALKKKWDYTKSFHFEIKHNSMFFDEGREERK